MLYLVEKYLKGFLVASGIKPKKIHTTATLTKQCAEINGQSLLYSTKISCWSGFNLQERRGAEGNGDNGRDNWYN